MLKGLRVAVALAMTGMPVVASAHGWVEPWHEDVLRSARSLVLADVSRAPDGGWRARVDRLLAGRPVPPQLEIRSYGLVGSGFEPIAGHPHPLRLEPGSRYYLLLMRDEVTQSYALATPASGFARLDGDHVIATYRHSLDHARVPRDAYESTVTAAFRAQHGQPVDGAAPDFVRLQLARPVADPEAAGRPSRRVVERFHLQHAALETHALVGGPLEMAILEPFLEAQTAQVQVSAVRALARIPGAASRSALLGFTAHEDRHPLARAMALRGLGRMEPGGLLPELRRIARETVDHPVLPLDTHFMDSRRLDLPPSLSAAVQEALAIWEGESSMAAVR